MNFFKKLKIELTYDPAISLLCIYQKEMKTGSQSDIASPWSQVDKLRQEEGKARGPPKLKSYLCYLQVVSNEDISLPL